MSVAFTDNSVAPSTRVWGLAFRAILASEVSLAYRAILASEVSLAFCARLSGEIPFAFCAVFSYKVPCTGFVSSRRSSDCIENPSPDANQ
jgi:hypothetical protein